MCIFHSAYQTCPILRQIRSNCKSSLITDGCWATEEREGAGRGEVRGRMGEEVDEVQYCIAEGEK